MDGVGRVIRRCCRLFVSSEVQFTRLPSCWLNPYCHSLVVGALEKKLLYTANTVRALYKTYWRTALRNAIDVYSISTAVVGGLIPFTRPVVGRLVGA